MTVEETPASVLRQIARWLHRIPGGAAQETRNALMLETVLFIAGTAALTMAVVSHVSDGPAGRADTLGAAAIAAYSWSCAFLSRRGFFRLAASLAVVGGLTLISFSYASYGL